MTSRLRDTTPFAYSLFVPPDPRAVGVSRACLRAALTAHQVPELIEWAELLSSEMLTNALLHSPGESGMRLAWRHGTLRMSVWDTDPRPPDPQTPGTDGEHGRGLHLMRCLADRRDHFPVGGHPPAEAKVVWCEIGRQPPAGW